MQDFLQEFLKGSVGNLCWDCFWVSSWGFSGIPPAIPSGISTVIPQGVPPQLLLRIPSEFFRGFFLRFLQYILLVFIQKLLLGFLQKSSWDFIQLFFLVQFQKFLLGFLSTFPFSVQNFFLRIYPEVCPGVFLGIPLGNFPEIYDFRNTSL